MEVTLCRKPEIFMKIISGGQTGVDRAALDVAILRSMDYGGAIPKGRKAEDGPIDIKYKKLTELNSKDYNIRTERNVIDSDATIVFTYARPSGGTAYTINCLVKHKKPYLLVDLKAKSKLWGINTIKEWLQKNNFRVINIAGPRESEVPGIYSRVFDILKEVFP